jgi:hypothetical protein
MTTVFASCGWTLFKDRVKKFDSDPDASFASIAPYIRVNEVQPASEDDLRKLDGLPQAHQSRLAQPMMGDKNVIRRCGIFKAFIGEPGG